MTQVDWSAHPALIDKTTAERVKFIRGNLDYWKAYIAKADKPGAINGFASVDAESRRALLVDLDIVNLLLHEISSE